MPGVAWLLLSKTKAHDEDNQIHVHRQAICASNKTDSKGGGDEDATVNAMVVYIFEAGRAFQAENDAGMADRVECVVKYDRGNRCERWLNQFDAQQFFTGGQSSNKLSRCVACQLHAERHQGATYPKPRSPNSWSPYQF